MSGVVLTSSEEVTPWARVTTEASPNSWGDRGLAGRREVGKQGWAQWPGPCFRAGGGGLQGSAWAVWARTGGRSLEVRRPGEEAGMRGRRGSEEAERLRDQGQVRKDRAGN